MNLALWNDCIKYTNSVRTDHVKKVDTWDNANTVSDWIIIICLHCMVNKILSKKLSNTASTTCGSSIMCNQ